jgi:hypothetical protein
MTRNLLSLRLTTDGVAEHSTRLQADDAWRDEVGRPPKAAQAKPKATRNGERRTIASP